MSFGEVLLREEWGRDVDVATKLKNNLLRRYLFKLQREREESKGTSTISSRVSSTSKSTVRYCTVLY